MTFGDLNNEFEKPKEESIKGVIKQIILQSPLSISSDPVKGSWLRYL